MKVVKAEASESISVGFFNKLFSDKLFLIILFSYDRKNANTMI